MGHTTRSTAIAAATAALAGEKYLSAEESRHAKIAAILELRWTRLILKGQVPPEEASRAERLAALGVCAVGEELHLELTQSAETGSQPQTMPLPELHPGCPLLETFRQLGILETKTPQ